jgi:hypothetical protein
MKSDSSASFVDSKVLVYAALKDDPRNQAAKNLLANTAHVVVLPIFARNTPSLDFAIKDH